MRPDHLATLAVVTFAAAVTACATTPAGGVTWDCPDGRSFTTTLTDSGTAMLTLDGETRRLFADQATRGAFQADSSLRLLMQGDSARVERLGRPVRDGCRRRVVEK